MWKVIRASVVGTSHVAAGTDCQDSCFADTLKTRFGEEVLIALVSDGAGSAKEGAAGAELACEVAMASIASSVVKAERFEPSEDGPVEWVKDVRRAIYERAEDASLAARDFACTLLGAVVGLNRSVFFQIGDGSMVTFTPSALGVVFWPDNGEYANMTRFVSDEDALDHLQVCVTGASVEELAMFSDGVQRLALSFEQKTAHGPFFEPMLAVLRRTAPEGCEELDSQLARFLGSEKVNERTDDDKTLILATRRA